MATKPLLVTNFARNPPVFGDETIHETKISKRNLVELSQDKTFQFPY
ncbi:hypothetical protein B4065_0208 [Caldibacillus thermoamylovorans]|nr:hypothetical protein [Caldibacillus sp. 210928-DFI.2.22]KIO60282.1 hypothetical protein B4065_0208 [Caldibacillus thermoamylovorans]